MTAAAGTEGLDEALRALWERSRPRLLARIAVLDEAGAALAAGTLDDDLRERARVEAHRLAGTLGTLGLPEASPVAKRLEHLLSGALRPETPEELAEGAATLRTLTEAGVAPR